MEQIDLIALYSGGLDSLLAIKLMQKQDKNILVLNFKHPFSKNIWQNHFREYFNTELGFWTWEVPLGQDFLDMVLHPQFGYGKNMNPCIDCKIFMYRRAAKVAQELGAYGIVTGEVLGQRPMSQNESALGILERETYLKGLVLRPLCAKVLTPTRLEEAGLVNRDKLLGFSGRNRTPQMELANEWDIENYQTPAGGCLLTDIAYSGRLLEASRIKKLQVFDTQLLKLGRHFRLPSGAKLVVGRFEEENYQLVNLAENKLILMEDGNNPGPMAALEGEATTVNITISGRIITRYSKSKEESEAKVNYRLPGTTGWASISVEPGGDEFIKEFLINPQK